MRLSRRASLAAALTVALAVAGGWLVSRAFEGLAMGSGDTVGPAPGSAIETGTVPVRIEAAKDRVANSWPRRQRWPAGPAVLLSLSTFTALSRARSSDQQPPTLRRQAARGCRPPRAPPSVQSAA